MPNNGSLPSAGRTTLYRVEYRPIVSHLGMGDAPWEPYSPALPAAEAMETRESAERRFRGYEFRTVAMVQNTRNSILHAVTVTAKQAGVPLSGTVLSRQSKTALALVGAAVVRAKRHGCQIALARNGQVVVKL